MRMSLVIIAVLLSACAEYDYNAEKQAELWLLGEGEIRTCSTGNPFTQKARCEVVTGHGCEVTLICSEDECRKWKAACP